jgi:chaperonin cofactor prefoldin
MRLRKAVFPCGLSIAAALAFAPLASAQESSGQGSGHGGNMMGGMQGMGGHEGHMMGGMQGEMQGMQGGRDHMKMMSHMMSMMQDRLSHTADRLTALKAELKITEEQTPAWTKFADAVLAASMSMQESMQHMQQEMMQHEKTEHGGAAQESGKTYPDIGAVKKTGEAAAQAGTPKSLPAKLAHRVEMLKQRLTNLEAIKEALDALYASLTEEQKKIADNFRISPMGLM